MKKVLIKIVIFFLIIGTLLCISYFLYNLYKDNETKEIKEKFYNCILENNFDKIFDYSLEKTIIDKKNNESYTSKTIIEFTNSFQNDYTIDINKLTIDSIFKSDSINQINSIKFNYSNNELFSFDWLQNDKYLAIKNSDILNSYIGINRNRKNIILKKLNESLSDFDINFSKFNMIDKISTNDNSIFSKSNEEYLSNIKKYIKSNKFLDEGSVIIEQNGNKTDANKYSLTISKQEFLNVYSVLTNMLLEDEDFINSIINNNMYNENEIEDIISNLDYKNVIKSKEEEIHALRGETENREEQSVAPESYSTDSIENWNVFSKIINISEKENQKLIELQNYDNFINASKCIFSACTGISLYTNDTELKNELNDVFQKLNNYFIEKIDDKSNIKIIIYEANGSTVKTNILLGDSLELNIDYINQIENKYQTVFTFYEKDESDNHNGYTVTITKNKTTAIDNNNVEIGIIKDNQIVNKIELKLNIEGTSNSTKYNNTINFLYSGTNGKFSSNIVNELNFENQEVEKISSDNTILIDNLDDSSFFDFMNRLNSRLDVFYNDKVSDLNLINTNISDKILQSNEQENIDSVNEEEKNKIIDMLIEKIGSEMGQAQNAGRTYTIQNLKDLKLDGYDVQVSLSNEIAIIKVGVYTFKIDKDFNLSD